MRSKADEPGVIRNRRVINMWSLRGSAFNTNYIHKFRSNCQGKRSALKLLQEQPVNFVVACGASVSSTARANVRAQKIGVSMCVTMRTLHHYPLFAREIVGVCQAIEGAGGNFQFQSVRSHVRVSRKDVDEHIAKAAHEDKEPAIHIHGQVVAYI